MELSTMEKLEILGSAAKYDVSCSSSGSHRKGQSGGIGNTMVSGICHSWTEDGRCVSLLKVLYSNACCYDCAYCVNRCSNDQPRASFSPKELAELTVEFYRRNYIEGLFLSSAVISSPDYTMQRIIRTLELLRKVYHFGGYIHAKVIPGASPELVEQAGRLADRISVNLEFASRRSMQLLAGQKTHQAMLTPMAHIHERRLETEEDSRRFASTPEFAPAGQTTQLIIGATGERDSALLSLSEKLYQRYELKRVYYSAYMPMMSHPLLPAKNLLPPLTREHRLYQADWLLRYYGFEAKEVLPEEHPNLDLELDPKTSYALRHPELFPVEVNKADYQMLLRVPGIGVRSAQRIVAARRFGSLNGEGLRKIGVVMKRAKYFLTAQGRFLGSCTPDNPFLREILKSGNPFLQTSLYDGVTTVSQAPAAGTSTQLVPLSTLGGRMGEGSDAVLL